MAPMKDAVEPDQRLLRLKKDLGRLRWGFRMWALLTTVLMAALITSWFTFLVYKVHYDKLVTLSSTRHHLLRSIPVNSLIFYTRKLTDLEDQSK